MLSLRVELVFKKIFGVEENKDLLISLINSVVSNEDQISEVQILNPYNVQNFKHDKLSVLNINAQAKCGKLFNIEMQIADDSYYDKREQSSAQKQCGARDCYLFELHILSRGFKNCLSEGRATPSRPLLRGS